MTAISLAPMAWGSVATAWGFMGITFWILLIALVVLLVRGTRNPARDCRGAAVRMPGPRAAPKGACRTQAAPAQIAAFHAKRRIAWEAGLQE